MISLRYSQARYENIGVNRRGSHFASLIYMDYIYTLFNLILFNFSHLATAAINTANNNNNQKKIVRTARPMGYISLRYLSSSSQNNNVLPSVGKISTNTGAHEELVEESLHS